MATTLEPPTANTAISTHEYHAEAHVLDGELHRPIQQKIVRQAPVTLHDRRGGHITRVTNEVNIEGLVSFTKGQTRVSGARSVKTNGWVTLSTSILEGFNIFEIVSADRVVSQVSTEHPPENGHFPHVTFLGTQFNNFAISGIPVSLTLDYGICGKRPERDKSYLQDREFLRRIKDQTKGITKADGLPKALKEQYDEKLDYIEELIGGCDEPEKGAHKPITCSLVQSIGKIPIPGVEAFGHVLVIPEFGRLALGEIEVGEQVYDGSDRPCIYFKLTGFGINMGCVGDATAAAPTASANGRHYP